MDLGKDKYLTPAPNLRRTRASHESQYTRYYAYSDALKNRGNNFGIMFHFLQRNRSVKEFVPVFRNNLPDHLERLDWGNNFCVMFYFLQHVV